MKSCHINIYSTPSSIICLIILILVFSPLQEAKKINSSLLQLSNVISDLSSRKKHINFRNSKLTELLEDSLGGNAKTLMFVNISPADYNSSESVPALE